MESLFRLTSYLNHFITARHTYGFHVHSPYLFDFTRNVIYEEHPYYCYSLIENYRYQLLKDNKEIFVEDFGTGLSGKRIISDIARKSLAQPKEAQLLFRIVNYTKAKKIVELGTSLGITTSYLTASDSNCMVNTFEGSQSIGELAHTIWEQMQINNRIKLHIGNINDLLPLYIKKGNPIDVAYIDANHTKEKTLEYFNLCLQNHHDNSIFIIDDIYNSKGMKDAWNQIKSQPEVTASIDLYQMGIVFFNPYFIKENYIMRF